MNFNDIKNPNYYQNEIIVWDEICKELVRTHDKRWIEAKPNLVDYFFTRILFRYINKKVYS